jgi:hypothetical protein
MAWTGIEDGFGSVQETTTAREEVQIVLRTEDHCLCAVEKRNCPGAGNGGAGKKGRRAKGEKNMDKGRKKKPNNIKRKERRAPQRKAKSSHPFVHPCASASWWFLSLQRCAIIQKQE